MSLSQNPDEDPTRIALSRGKTTVLSGEQRERYARDGFLSIEGLVGTDWLERLRTVTAEFVEGALGALIDFIKFFLFWLFLIGGPSAPLREGPKDPWRIIGAPPRLPPPGRRRGGPPRPGAPSPLYPRPHRASSCAVCVEGG